MKLRDLQFKSVLLGAVLGSLSASVLWAAVPQVGGQDRAAIEAVIRDYLLANPEIIPEAMERLQAREAGKVVEANRAAIETPFAGAWAGNPKGDVVLVEFFDYACGYCRTSVKDVDRLLAEDKGLKVVYRELPILSADSEAAARVSLAAAKQNRFLAFHHAMYAAGRVDAPRIAQARAAAGIKPDPAAADLDEELGRNIELARALRVSGTPAWVVGDQVLIGGVGYDKLKAAIAEARAAKRS